MLTRSVQSSEKLAVHGLLQAGTAAIGVTGRMESVPDIARNDDEDLSELTASINQSSVSQSVTESIKFIKNGSTVPY